jgi:hypothetical protein
VLTPVVFGVQGQQPPVPLLHPAAPSRGHAHPASPPCFPGSRSRGGSCSFMPSLRPGPDG